jgi:hypothetical protein
MALNGPSSSLNRQWGRALREQNEDRLVRCDRCGQTAVLEPVAGSTSPQNRRNWPVVPCVFTPGCGGAVAPEPLN